MLAPIRWTTVHPLLVHVTIGVLPLVLLAYAVAIVRRSERWWFAGDVALFFGTLVTVATFAFGLVSNALVPWPGGIETWRWLHLGLAIGSTVLLLLIAFARVRARRRQAMAGVRTLLATAVLAAAVAATGWVGGEVLVFHSGMAVAAAGQGALAPAISLSGGAPHEFPDAMGLLRGAWAEATTQFDLMLVKHPSDEGYRRVAAAAHRIGELAEWVEKSGPAALAKESREEQAQHGAKDRDEEASDASVIAEMAKRLKEQASALERAAQARQWPGVTQGIGAVTSTCAGCHMTVRWAE